MAISEIKAHLSDALRAVELRGERIVVERHGRPVALIQPFVEGQELGKPWVEALAGVAAEFDDFEAIMGEVVASRAGAEPRVVNLDEPRR